MTKRVDGRVRERASDEVESQVKVGKGEVCEEEVDELVDEFNVEEYLPADGVISMPDLAEVDERVDGCEEGAVEPPSSLRDELGDGIWRF